MPNAPGQVKILVVDKRAHWREHVCRVLGNAGFESEGIDISGLLTSLETLSGAHVVLLGCGRIGGTELSLVRALADQGQCTVVFSTQLSTSAMRQGFLAGACDVERKTYESEALLRVVDNSLRAREAASDPARWSA